MVDQIIRPADLPNRANPNASEKIPVDNGSTVGGATVESIVLSGRPTASQAEAEAGTDAVKAMTPLTSRQGLASQIGVTIASKAQGDLATTAVQPGDLATVATTGDYDDLSNKPVIPPGLTDGDKGDISVSSGGSVWKINKEFDTVADLIADVSLGYAGSGSPVSVVPGDIVVAQGFRYEVAASGATDHHVITAGGVKMNVQPSDDGSFNALAFGAGCNRTGNDAPIVQKAIDHCLTFSAPAKLVIPGPCRVTETMFIDRPVDETLGVFVIEGAGPGAGFYAEDAVTLFSSRLPYGSFGSQKAPPSEYTTFSGLLFEALENTLDAYVVDDKLFRTTSQNCVFRRIKYLKEADYVQSIRFLGCKVRGHSGDFLHATDGYDVEVSPPDFEAGGAGFVFDGSVSSFKSFGGLYEGSASPFFECSGVNGLAIAGLYAEHNDGSEIVLGTNFGVSRGVSICGCQIASTSIDPDYYPIILGIAYGVSLDGNYSNGNLANIDFVRGFELSAGKNSAIGKEFSTNPWVNSFVVAHAGGGQAGATELFRTSNIVAVVASAGDSVKIPIASTKISEPIKVLNYAVEELALFPSSGQTINSLAVNASIVVPSGAIATCFPSQGGWFVSIA